MKGLGFKKKGNPDCKRKCGKRAWKSHACIRIYGLVVGCDSECPANLCVEVEVVELKAALS